MNVASAIHISSNALILLGDDPISSFDEEGAGSRVAKNFYETSLRAILAEYVWSFAKKKIKLNRLVEKPLNGYEYMFQIPTDHIRTLTVKPITDYEIVDDKIYTDAKDLDLDYIYRVDESFFPPMFREALELYFAAKWAIPVTENSTNADKYFAMYMKQMKKAKTIDAQSDTAVTSPAIESLGFSMRHRSFRRR